MGGPWHEFEVDGINYGPTEDTYSKDRPARREHDRENSIGLEGWRVELSPKVNAETTNFLVVLQATDQQSSGSELTVERIERQGHPGARVTVKDTVYEVTFVPVGQPGGHIRVEQSGRPIVDRGLASGIEDDYRKWATDPRYKTWTTRSEYGNFMGVRAAD